MLLNEAIRDIPGLRYMTDRLEIQSGLGRSVLLSGRFLTAADALLHEQDLVRMMLDALNTGGAAADKLCIKLAQLRDIRGTVERLAARETLDDIELFEVKAFALLTTEMAPLIDEAGMGFAAVQPLYDVAEPLDPEGSGVAAFYIYDGYSDELADVRKRIKAFRKEHSEESLPAELLAENDRCEQIVRERLSKVLAAQAAAISDALYAAARLDILIAKAKQAMEMRLSLAELSEGETVYKGLFYPPVRDLLSSEGREFQPIDLSIGGEPTLITGVNMGGKTLALKSAALAQALFQFGFAVPAAHAEIAPVESIEISMDEGQDEMKGLSSFAAEMLRIDAIVRAVRAGDNILALIDEPARTTNPTDGRAIVHALMSILTEYGVRALTTTHYGGIEAPRKLRVAGFREHGGDKVTPSNIDRYMDYALLEDDGTATGGGALQIAEILGVDGGLIAEAERYLNLNNK